MSTLESNKLIAEFMGVEPMNWNPSHAIKDYHNSWNMIMNVIDKIESDIYLHIKICKLNCAIYWMGVEPEDKKLFEFLESFKGIDVDSDTKIKAVYTAIVYFILIYNKSLTTQLQCGS